MGLKKYKKLADRVEHRETAAAAQKFPDAEGWPAVCAG